MESAVERSNTGPELSLESALSDNGQSERSDVGAALRQRLNELRHGSSRFVRLVVADVHDGWRTVVEKVRLVSL